MEKITGCCGFKCYKCAAYEGNIKSEADRKKVADRWKEYFAYEINPKEITCKGCFADDSQKEFMLHSDCEFRNCVLEKGLVSCEECNAHPCDKLKEYVGAYKSCFEEIKDKVREEDVEPYFTTYTSALK